jgi:glycosyltransferase involved in cell wall biosynthesis
MGPTRDIRTWKASADVISRETSGSIVDQGVDGSSVGSAPQPLPDVSVVITTYRRERLVLEAIDSVRSQRGVLAEIVVADDSPEGTARPAIEALRDPCVRYMHRTRPSGGLPGLVRNDGVQLTRAPLVHFLDDDDRLADGALSVLTEAMHATGAGLGFGRIVPFGDEPALTEQTQYFRRMADRARRLRGRRLWFAAHLLFLDSLIVNSACMVRRDVFEAVRGYDGSLRCCEDVELCLRIGRRHGVTFVDQDILHYRVGSPSIMKEVRDRPGHPSMLDAYRTMSTRYQERYGVLEYRSLQVLAKTVKRLALA